MDENEMVPILVTAAVRDKFVALLDGELGDANIGYSDFLDQVIDRETAALKELRRRHPKGSHGPVLPPRIASCSTCLLLDPRECVDVFAEPVS
jgi:hypothetical protein